MNQGFWATKSPDCLNGAEMGYTNASRMDPKRPPQWALDGSELELLPNKKQAIEASPDNGPYSGMLLSNLSQWNSAPHAFPSYPTQFSNQCYESEGAKAMGFDDKNFPLMNTDKVNLGRKLNENPFVNDPSFNLSMTQMLENPHLPLTYGGAGFRKVKISEVKDSENFLTGSIGHAYGVESNTGLLNAPAYNKVDDNLILSDLSYNKGEENTINVGNNYESSVNNFVSMGQEITSNGQAFNKGNSDYLSQSYKSESSILSACQSYNKGESTMISFGGYDDDYEVNGSERIVPNDELLMGITTALKQEAVNDTDFINSGSDALVNPQNGASRSFSKKKDDPKTSKKVPSNNFPPNVRSLLSTGMLDGVPVKYIAWSREELPGVIKGSGYLCGCQLCNYTKVINAFEFERHASCKTKHPNNHIYFENGKTIYGTVQELKSTPQNMLFDVIQTITGSPINQKSFRLWKESFLAATRELKRIYGTDGKPSS